MILREIVGRRVVAKRVLARGQRLDAGQNLDQGRFPRAIHTHQSHTVAALDREIHALEHQLRAVTLGHIVKLGHHAAAGFGLREMEVNRMLFSR